MKRRAFIIGAPLALAACGSGEDVWAPDAAVARAMYRGEGPTRLTLYTTLNTGSGNGAHSALLINASQRVLFDPAGSFGHATIPERNDVLFGITPQIQALYIEYHSYQGYSLVEQQLEVTPEVAEMVLRLAMENGSVPKMFCAKATSAILRQVPGLSGLPSGFSPDKLATAFGEIPGVQTRNYAEHEDTNAAQVRAAIDDGLTRAP